MIQQIVNGVVPVIVAGLVAVLVAIIKAVSNVTVSFIVQKEKALEVKVGKDTFERNLNFAKAAWNIVDENFRITASLEKTVTAKQEMFAAELKKFVPSLTDAEIEQLRQAVAGEINKGKAAITEAATVNADSETGTAVPADSSK